MKKVLSLLFFNCLYFAFSIQSYAKTIYIHTESINDFSALEGMNPENNFSVSTNLHALNNQSENIEYEYMTTKRSLLLMDNSKNICVVDKIKTKKRIEEYLFSKPVNLFLSRRLYQNASFSVVGGTDSRDESVSLSSLFIERPKSQIIISGQISYGDVLDAQISKLPEGNVLLRHSGEHDEGVIAMFAAGRAEFALLYPQQVYDSDLKVNGRSYSISSVPPYILGHLMCTNNEVTKAFIQSVNDHLSDSDSLAELLKIHLQYTNPIDKLVIESYFSKEFH